MRIEKRILKIAALFLMAGAHVAAHAGEQVLATVGKLQVTASELNKAMASAPFSNKFPSMDENDQAGLRGDMLRRLVVAKLLKLEAQRLGMNQSVAYRKDLDDFRQGLLYRAYMDKLRKSVVIPADTQAAMKKQFKEDRGGMEAAQAAYVSERYRELKQSSLQNLLKQDKVQFHEERITPGIRPDTVLAAGTTLRVRYGDLLDAEQKAASSKSPAAEWVKDQLSKRVELIAAANAALKQGSDVAAEVQRYDAERLPALLMETKTHEWIPGDKTLRDWYGNHPEAAKVPERRHVGQLVAASLKEAEALRARIVKGESLFVLAGQHSIDPFSRKQNGDVGWVVQGRGLPELEQALEKLQDGATSEVIKTTDGKFHILTILERVPGRTEPFEKMRERIAQSIVSEKLPKYVGELEKRYGVTWNVIKPAPTAGADKPQGK